MLSAHSATPIPVINFSGLGVEDVLIESYPPPPTTPFARANASHTPHPHHFNFFHHWDMHPALDCQTGYVCSYLRHTQLTADNDRDGDGRVDREKLHAEEVKVDRDGDGDVDVNDELPTDAQSDEKHLELVFGKKVDSTVPAEEQAEPYPMWLEYLGACVCVAQALLGFTCFIMCTHTHTHTRRSYK